MLKKNIAFIGSGAMGEAMIAGLICRKLSKPEQLSDRAPAQSAEELKKNMA